MAIGCGKQEIAWTEQLLELKDRQLAGVTASPCGLYLGGVFYPEQYGMPKHPVFNKLPAHAQRYQH
jgi:tRNA pseudouridine38-40 synthase